MYVYKSNILIIHFKDHCVHLKTSIIINLQELTSFGFQQDLGSLSWDFLRQM